MTGSIYFIPPQPRAKKDIWMFRESNIVKLAPKVNVLSITPWFLGLVERRRNKVLNELDGLHTRQMSSFQEIKMLRRNLLEMSTMSQELEVEGVLSKRHSRLKKSSQQNWRHWLLCPRFLSLDKWHGFSYYGGISSRATALNTAIQLKFLSSLKYFL